MVVMAADVISHLAFVDEGVDGLADDEKWNDWAAHEAFKALKKEEEEEEKEEERDHGEFEGDYGEFNGEFEEEFGEHFD